MNIYIIHGYWESCCDYHYIDLLIFADTGEQALKKAKEFCKDNYTVKFYLHITLTHPKESNLDIIVIEDDNGSK